MSSQPPNQRGAEDAAIPVLFHTGRQWRGASDPGRSASSLVALDDT
jgi:predicted TIM-barrel fold metal-dependent hydrolase